MLSNLWRKLLIWNQTRYVERLKDDIGYHRRCLSNIQPTLNKEIRKLWDLQEAPLIPSNNFIPGVCWVLAAISTFFLLAGAWALVRGEMTGGLIILLCSGYIAWYTSIIRKKITYGN